MNWIVVLPFAGADWQAHTGMLRAGIKSFMAYTLGDARRGRWSQGVVRPMYPGYIFATIKPGVSIENVRRVVGVSDVLKDRKGVVAISEAQVFSCKSHWLRTYRETAPRLVVKPVIEVGTWLSVPYGAFKGAPCQVSTLDKSGNICASIGSLQVTFHVSDVGHEAVRARAALAGNLQTHVS